MTELNITTLGGCDGQEWQRIGSQALRHSKENTGLASMPQTAFSLPLVFPDRSAVLAEWGSLLPLAYFGLLNPRTPLHDEPGLWPHQPDRALSTPVRTHFNRDFSEGRHLCKAICACAIHCSAAPKNPQLP